MSEIAVRDTPSPLNRAMRLVAQPFVVVMQNWMPNPFIFAALLSILTFVLAIAIAGYSPGATVEAWGDGFWRLLEFTTQIAMTLITGYALAHTPAVHRLLDRVAGLVNTPATAYALVCFIACIGSLLSWGMGLIVGAIIAREVANVCLRRGLVIHYPLLVASAYSGFVIWHMGLSSSVGLAIATDGHFLEEQIGLVPTSQTIFSYWNITMILLVMVTLPFVMMLLRPPESQCVPIRAELTREDEADIGDQPHPHRTPAERMDDARVFNWLLGAAGVVYLFYHFFIRGEVLNLNIVNFTFLIAGLLLTRSPLHYVDLIAHGGRTLGPILLQYPFYAGIMGMMTASGLAQIVADWFVSFSTAQTLPWFAMLSGGLINLFIPSGGGQWAVQGPVMLTAAEALGADIPRVAMGVAIGDQWTNMIQPFWTIPALAIVGLHVRDIMGYTVIAFLWTGLIFSLGLIFL
jgi:short-chain fatty acids transporter